MTDQKQSTSGADPVYVYEWPEGTPLPPGAVDGMAAMIDGDEDFEYGDAGAEMAAAEADRAGGAHVPGTDR